MNIRPGDGIATANGNRYVVDGLLRDSITREAIGVTYTDRDGIRHSLPFGSFRMETFVEYCFRPTGFGRTHWIAALWVHAFGAVSVGMAIAGEPWALLGLVAPVALWVGTYMNYTGRWR